MEVGTKVETKKETTLMSFFSKELIKKSLNDFFSPVSNIRYTISAIRGMLPDEERKEDHKPKSPKA